MTVLIYQQFKKNLLIDKLNWLISSYHFKKKDHDLYHLTYYNKYYKSNKPKIITVYDLIHEKFKDEYNFDELPKKKILDEVDHYICISHNTKKDLVEYYNIDDKKISVTHLGSSMNIIQNVEYKIDKPFFLFVGSRKRYKNFRLFLKSFSKLNEIKKNFDIVCFGGGNFLKEELDYLQELSIDIKKVKNIQGSDKILASLYKSSFSLVYPSSYEGFGLPILEAMSCGCPVIASNSSSLPEVYGDSALSFENNSVENLCDCIKKISTDNSLRSLLIKKGLQRSKEFSWKKCALETSIIYKKLI